MISGAKAEVHKGPWQKTFRRVDFLPQHSQGNNFPSTIYGSVNDVVSVLYARVGSPKPPCPFLVPKCIANTFLLSCLLSPLCLSALGCFPAFSFLLL